MSEHDMPQCSWPAEVWPMTREEYVKAVPNPDTRTAVSGYLMRLGWEAAIYQIEKMMREESE